ncbi:MAG: helix-turn-helix domain-containing protein [Solirubrobacterales bacterium]
MQRQLPPNRLRELRNGRDLKLYDLAALLRVDPATIFRWEAGDTAIPDWAKLALAEFFKVEPTYLMGWDEVAA